MTAAALVLKVVDADTHEVHLVGVEVVARCTGVRDAIPRSVVRRCVRPVSRLRLLSIAVCVGYEQQGDMVELHSERESFRRVLVFRAPDGSAATLLVLRRDKAVWLTFSGAEKTSVTMNDSDTDDLMDALAAARRRPQR